MSEAKYKILYLEDDQVDQMLFKRLMKEKADQVDYVLASSIAEFKALWEKDTYDLVITDNVLNDGNVFDILDYLKATPFLFTSGVEEQELGHIASKIKADACLSKPFTKEELFAKINRVLRINGGSASAPADQAKPSGKDKISLEFLQKIAGNDRHFIIEMLELYLNSMPQSVKSIRDSYNQGNWKQLRMAAHKLKTNLRAIGKKQLATVCERIEAFSQQEARQNNIDSLICQLEHQYETVFEEIKVKLNALKRSVEV